MSETPLDPRPTTGRQLEEGAEYAASVATQVQTMVKQAPVGQLATGRIVTYLGAAAGLATALAPVLGNLDITSTVGLVGGMGAVAAVVVTWLRGWQKYEADVRDPTKFNEPTP